MAISTHSGGDEAQHIAKRAMCGAPPAEVDRALAEVAQAPQRWASGPYHTRRFLLRKFPFVLIYRERTGDIQVVAIAHTSRKPGHWKGRI